MKQAVLIIVKPDGMSKNLVGEVFTKFAQTQLEIVAARIIKPTRTLTREHYQGIKGKPFFESTVSYFCGKYHDEDKLIAAIYYGNNAIKKCRKAVGATDPRDADSKSIRGAYGGISSTGIFENVVHVSSDEKEAEREIKLWFCADDIVVKLYSTKTNVIKNFKKKDWL